MIEGSLSVESPPSLDDFAHEQVMAEQQRQVWSPVANHFLVSSSQTASKTTLCGVLASNAKKPLKLKLNTVEAQFSGHR